MQKSVQEIGVGRKELGLFTALALSGDDPLVLHVFH